MPDDWRKIARGLWESADGQWRFVNPLKVTAELRHRWLVAQRRSSGTGWCMHDDDHATLQDARAYVETLSDAAGSASDRPDQRAGDRLGSRQQVRPEESPGQTVNLQRHAWGQAYRDGSLICGRVHVTFGRDDRLGLAPRERR